LDERWLLGPKARLAALIDHVGIYLKGVSHIYCSPPQHYFVCLLELEDVAPHEALGDRAPTMQDDFWKKLLRGTALDAPLAELVVAALVDSPPAALVVAAEVRPDFAQLPFTSVRSDGRSVTIHFDNITHSVRRPRADPVQVASAVLS
jgi:hypothetical protein